GRSCGRGLGIGLGLGICWRVLAALLPAAPTDGRALSAGETTATGAARAGPRRGAAARSGRVLKPPTVGEDHPHLRPIVLDVAAHDDDVGRPAAFDLAELAFDAPDAGGFGRQRR